jgi:antitoxin ParD1/3/4
MNVSIGPRWEVFVETAVKSGRYGSASEVVREGLRLVEEREAKLKALRDTLNASIVEGDPGTDDDPRGEVGGAGEIRLLSASTRLPGFSTPRPGGDSRLHHPNERQSRHRAAIR